MLTSETAKKRRSESTKSQAKFFTREYRGHRVAMYVISKVSWDVLGDPRTSCLAAPSKVPVLTILRCPGRSQDIPLGRTGQSSSPTYPGMSREIPGHPAWPHRAVLSILGCPGRSQDILLGCTGQSPSPKYPGMSREDPRTSRLAASPSPKYPGMSREIPGHPAWLQVPVLSILGCPGKS